MAPGAPLCVCVWGVTRRVAPRGPPPDGPARARSAEASAGRPGPGWLRRGLRRTARSRLAPQRRGRLAEADVRRSGAWPAGARPGPVRPASVRPGPARPDPAGAETHSPGRAAPPVSGAARRRHRLSAVPPGRGRLRRSRVSTREHRQLRPGGRVRLLRSYPGAHKWPGCAGVSLVPVARRHVDGHGVHQARPQPSPDSGDRVRRHRAGPAARSRRPGPPTRSASEPRWAALPRSPPPWAPASSICLWRVAATTGTSPTTTTRFPPWSTSRRTDTPGEFVRGDDGRSVRSGTTGWQAWVSRLRPRVGRRPADRGQSPMSHRLRCVPRATTWHNARACATQSPPQTARILSSSGGGRWHRGTLGVRRAGSRGGRGTGVRTGRTDGRGYPWVRWRVGPV